MRRWEDIAGYSFSVVLIAIGLQAFWCVYVADYSKPVEGRVLEAHEMVTIWTEGLYSPFLPFRYMFSYSYTVDGHTYRSSRYASLPYKGFREAVKRYSVGDKIRVWVHPRKPSRAIIDKRVRGTDVAATAIGLVLMGFLWLCRLAGRKRMETT